MHTNVQFTHEGKVYTVTTFNGEVSRVVREVHVNGMQPHTRKIRIRGDRLYEISKAFEQTSH